MMLVFFLALAPCYRLVLCTYRYYRTKQLKERYDLWLTNEIRDKFGKRESIYNYSHEITKLIQSAGIYNFVFIGRKDDISIKNDAAALQKAIGIFKHEIKCSFFPHTYLLMLINLPRSLSNMLKIPPTKALLLILYAAYSVLGILDVSLLVDKIINLLC